MFWKMIVSNVTCIWVVYIWKGKGPYYPICMFEPNIFNFHTYNVTDNHFPKHTTGTVN
ncbi:hypothetical protein LDENG_00184180 [Lucifuga dentata]|nr:hypothetical protein LDENG_00184180 [Lucifuga dentata]